MRLATKTVGTEIFMKRPLTLTSIAFACLVALMGCVAGCGLKSALPEIASGTLTITSGDSSNTTLSSTSIIKNTQTSLKAKWIESNGTSTDVTTQVSWSSSDTAIATISSAGIVSAISVGTTYIGASLSGLGGAALALQVSAAPVALTPSYPLTAISISTSSTSISAGVTAAYIATGTYSDGSTAVITSSVTWYSSNTTVASLAGSGGVLGLTAGTTNISASLGVITSATSTLTVTQPFLYISTPANTVNVCKVVNGGPTLTGCGATGSGFTSLQQITVSPGGNFLYVSNYDGLNSIDYCAINQTTGALSGCTSKANMYGPLGAGFNGSGDALYISSGSGVVRYTVNTTNGALTNSGIFTFPPFPTSGFCEAPGHVVGNAANTFMYVLATWCANTNIVSCAVSNTALSCTRVTSSNMTGTGSPLVINPAGTKLYFIQSGAVKLCNLNTTDGSIVGGACSTTALAAAGFTSIGGVVINAANTYAFITDNGANKVYSCAINADGTFSGCVQQAIITGGGSMAYKN